MDKNKAKELSDILLAYSQGKTIQYYTGKAWIDIDNFVSGILKEASMDIGGQYLELRVKPELKLVPFTFEDKQLLKDRWVTQKEFTAISKIIRVASNGVLVANDAITYSRLFHAYEFEDGSPCGKYIEE